MQIVNAYEKVALRDGQPFLFLMSHHSLHLFQSFAQQIHLFARVVEHQGCANRAFDAEMLHQRLRAMRAGAYRYPHLVEDHARVVGMNVV